MKQRANKAAHSSAAAKSQSRPTAAKSSETKRSIPKGVFLGPSVDGADHEYVKVISGKVTDRKPSFA
ncbi:hypothetical protein [Gorillibacterium massiliense]|uniref:hypothetical protein n=1 Tax=Gorillibacterium massiliense TaxID=1280390 RepID=UPI0004B91184|nr:hypothetical protein [Gorillibacterium massiliense]